MKTAMARSRLTVPSLTAMVAPELGYPDGTDKIRRWLVNESAIDPVALPVPASPGLPPDVVDQLTAVAGR